MDTIVRVRGTLRRRVRGERFYAKSRLPIGRDYTKVMAGGGNGTELERKVGAPS